MMLPLLTVSVSLRLRRDDFLGVNVFGLGWFGLVMGAGGLVRGWASQTCLKAVQSFRDLGYLLAT